MLDARLSYRGCSRIIKKCVTPLKTVEPINKRPELTDPVKIEAEARAIARATQHTEEVLAEYAARLDTFGGRYVSADTFKELMPGFAQSRESRNALNGAVHNAAAVLSSEQFRRVVERGPQPGRDTVVFVTGIPGAGKSSSVVSAVEDGAAAVFEGQMSRPEPTIQKIEHALRKGFKIAIVAVHVEPEVALERTNYRFCDPNNGRGASLFVMSEIQGNLPAGLRQIQNRFGDRIDVSVLDNNPSQQTFYKGWEAIPILEKEGNHERIRERLNAALESGYLDGRYSADFYAQATGRRPDARLASSLGRKNGGEQQADANRLGIPQASSEHDALKGQSGPSVLDETANLAPPAGGGFTLDAIDKNIKNDWQSTSKILQDISPDRATPKPPRPR
jgi:hypothetical protein